MPKKKIIETPELVKRWMLSIEATFGSSVRIKGILLEMRARLPSLIRKSLDVDGNVLTLGMMENARREFSAAVATITEALVGTETLPVIPREIQDILAITASERHRWLKDGRLASAGTRTVRLSGRARQITFHVFDPKLVVDLLDRGIVDEWRVQDAEAAAENRRRAAYRSKLTRSIEVRVVGVSGPLAEIPILKKAPQNKKIKINGIHKTRDYPRNLRTVEVNGT